MKMNLEVLRSVDHGFYLYPFPISLVCRSWKKLFEDKDYLDLVLARDDVKEFQRYSLDRFVDFKYIFKKIEKEILTFAVKNNKCSYNDLKSLFQYGRYSMVKYLFEELKVIIASEPYLVSAVSSGNLELVEYLLKRNFVFSDKVFEIICFHDNLEMLELFEKYTQVINFNVLEIAIDQKNKRFIEWCVSKRYSLMYYNVDQHIDDSEFLEWLLLKGIRFYSKTLITAFLIAKDRRTTLSILLPYFYSKTGLVVTMIKNQCFPDFLWLLDQGYCPTLEDLCNSVMLNAWNFTSLMVKILPISENLLRTAVDHNNLTFLLWCKDNNIISETVILRAIEIQNLEFLRYLLLLGFPVPVFSRFLINKTFAPNFLWFLLWELDFPLTSNNFLELRDHFSREDIADLMQKKNYVFNDRDIDFLLSLMIKGNCQDLRYYYLQGLVNQRLLLSKVNSRNEKFFQGWLLE